MFLQCLGLGICRGLRFCCSEMNQIVWECLGEISTGDDGFTCILLGKSWSLGILVVYRELRDRYTLVVIDTK